mgnify:CR=1 FL=1
MPIQIVETESVIINDSGIPLSEVSTYTSNVGDKVVYTVRISDRMQITSINNPLTYDPITNSIISPAKNWLDEGFRVNDKILTRVFSQAGVITAASSLVCEYVDDTQLDLFGGPANFGFYDMTANETMQITCQNFSQSQPKKREDLYIKINHTLNSAAGNPSSVIDGEQTQISFLGLRSINNGQTINGNIIGNQSGQFLISAQITYDGFTGINNSHEYILTFTFINSGLYTPSSFAQGDCLKLYIEGLWSAEAGEVFNRAEFEINNQANTGFLDEAYNVSVPTGGSVLTPIGDLAYNQNTTGTFIVDTAGESLNNLDMGGAYISTDETYYKNRPEAQQNITMILPTKKMNVGTTYISTLGLSQYNNPSWGFRITNRQIISGTTAAIDFEFIVGAEFEPLMESFLDGDRLFYMWIRIGNTNHTVYANQLTKVLPIGGPLPMENDYGFLDHGQNIDLINGNQVYTDGYPADTEDDLAYYGIFKLENNITDYESINLRVEAYNDVTNDKFTLQQTNFSLSGVIYQASTGQYLLNESATINPNLPTTSVKRTAKVINIGNNGTTHYNVSVYYPFLLSWKYWLTLANASTDFAPTQDQNWEQYDNLPNWCLRFTVELAQNGLAYVHSNKLIDYVYDNDPDIISNLDLKLQSNGQSVAIIPDGEQLFIESTHERVNGNWDINKTWGMLTIEPKESSPRFICSTIVPFDNNAQNPLQPITGLLCSLSYPSPNIAVLKCKFNTNLLDTSNGVKITAKIKEGCFNIIEQGKITTLDEQKLTTNDIDKIIA